MCLLIYLTFFSAWGETLFVVLAKTDFPNPDSKQSSHFKTRCLFTMDICQDLDKTETMSNNWNVQNFHKRNRNHSLRLLL